MYKKISRNKASRHWGGRNDFARTASHHAQGNYEPSRSRGHRVRGKYERDYIGRTVFTSDDTECFEGKIDMSSRGYGFLISEGREDVFVHSEDLNGARHGDIVRAVMISHRKNGGEGRVVEIIQRNRMPIVGSFVGGARPFVIPDDRRYGDIRVDCKPSLQVETGDKVVVALSGGDQLRGEITEVIHGINALDTDITAIIRSFNLTADFPAKTVAEARSVARDVTEDEVRGRRDFRRDMVITIDGDDSKDFDDAVSITRTRQGYSLHVHIADVAHYVKAFSKTDKEAYRRGTSVYFADRVIPMLPFELSNGICSLNPGVDRLTLSVLMDLDHDGNIIDYKITEGVIRSQERMTYRKVQAILDGDREMCAVYAHIAPMLQVMKELTDKRLVIRESRGAIGFDIIEPQITVCDGEVTDISCGNRLYSHRIIEEFMLLANECVATRFVQLKAPFVYRVHAAPSQIKVCTLNDFLDGVGLTRVPENPSPRDIATLIERVPDNLRTAVGKVALRSMMKACYRSSNDGHYGLALSNYCHFTSPIRRYPDLCIHRIIKDYLHAGEGALARYTDFVSDAARQSSEREVIAEEAERKVDALLIARYMSGKIGMQFVGLISGVTEWAFFVELDNGVEGIVRVENLAGRYDFDPKTFTLSRGAVSYRLGDVCRVQVVGVSDDRVEMIALNQ